MIKVIGQPWCGESVRIVKLSHLGLVEVPHNPVHVILIIIIIIIIIIIMIVIQIIMIRMVEVPHNPVHAILILREDFPFPQKYQQDLVLFCYLSRPCVAWGGPAIG